MFHWTGSNRFFLKFRFYLLIFKRIFFCFVLFILLAINQAKKVTSWRLSHQVPSLSGKIISNVRILKFYGRYLSSYWNHHKGRGVCVLMSKLCHLDVIFIIWQIAVVKFRRQFDVENFIESSRKMTTPEDENLMRQPNIMSSF